MSALAALAGLAVPDADVERAGELARRVLSRPEFRPPRRTLLERVWAWLSDLLDRVAGALGSGPGGGLVAWVVLGGAVALLVLVIVRRVGDGRRWSPRRSATTATTIDDRWDGTRWRAEAARLRAAGDRRGALRALYQALAADVARRAHVSDPPATTPGELLERVRAARPVAAAPMEAATAAFEATWYGGAAVDDEALDRFAADAAEVLASVARPATPAAVAT